MRVEILQGGRVLPTIHHNGQVFVKTPKSGDYSVRLTNNSPNRRMGVLSVDGINAVDGSAAGHDGPGYVLGPWESIEVTGWHRTSSKVASFAFGAQEASYAKQRGQGVKNVGVIGVAVFDEKRSLADLLVPRQIHHHHYPPYRPWTIDWPPTIIGGGWASGGGTYGSNGGGGTFTTNSTSGGTLSSTAPRSSEAKSLGGIEDVGTVYGREKEMHTKETTFERATPSPALVVALHYATRERLQSWGVPTPVSAPSADPFPASTRGCPAPAGWTP